MSPLFSALLLAAPAPGEPTQADLLKMADQIVARVAQVRGLKPMHPVAKGVLGREAIRDKLMSRIKKEYSPEEIADEERVLKRLGLLPPEVDYEKAVMNLLLEQIAGFYDPFDRKLYIADWLPEEMQTPTLAHEIAHALQDQHFGLKSYATPIKDNGDRQLARSALVEGDGTAVMLETMMPHGDLSQLPDSAFDMAGSLASIGSELMPAYERAPRFLRETLIFPYVTGLAFVRRIRKIRPWSAVDAVYQSPPESTEQVIHPEKYFAHEHPVSVEDRSVPSLKDRRLVRRDVLGELVIRLYLEEANGPEQARTASEGWGGDRLAAFSPEGTQGGAPLVVHLSVWDTELDADEFARAASRVLSHMTGAPETVPPASYKDASGTESSVERRGTRVLQVLGAPADRRGQLVEEIWKAWKVGQRPAGGPQ
jgi:hypothetical protein